MSELLEAAPPDRPATMESLGAVTSLFARLHADNILYCHWKSNEHLDASMVGATDLDLLVDRKDALPLARVFSELGVKRFVVRPFHGYPGVEDYVCFDPQTGTLIHLHVHYQLTVGEKHLNGHRLPWEQDVLSTRVLDARHEVYVADPHMEILVLVARAALKVRTRDRLLAALGRTYVHFGTGKLVKEFAWLARRVEPERLLGLARRLVGERAARTLLEMVGAPPPSRRQLRAFGQSAVPRLSTYRTYGAWGGRCRRWLREARDLWWHVSNRYYRVPKNSDRTCPQGGLIIACVGAEGAGKSTVAKEIAEWLSGEVAVLPISAPGDPHGAARAWRRRATLARRAQNLGKIVVLDGLPRTDSPGLSEELCSPDIVVKLHVSPETARRRRPDVPLDRLRSQTALVQGLSYPAARRVMDIDANQPPESFLPELRQAIWDVI